MNKFLKDKIVRIRCKKDYPDAHTHVIIGKVVDETTRYIVISGRAFHFRRLVDRLRNQVQAGDVMVRIVPGENIEVIHWISEKTDASADFEFDGKGNLVLRDKPHTVIAAGRDME